MDLLGLFLKFPGLFLKFPGLFLPKIARNIPKTVRTVPKIEQTIPRIIRMVPQFFKCPGLFVCFQIFMDCSRGLLANLQNGMNYIVDFLLFLPIVSTHHDVSFVAIPGPKLL